MNTEYLVFSSETCTPCKALKQFLDANNVPYTVHDASTNKAASMGVRSVPTSFKLVDGKVMDTMYNYNVKEAKQFFGV